jgi:UDP-N-acetyl-D-mannosaminuronic acid transferase (WecB/TagA/CpsF family)
VRDWRLEWAYRLLNEPFRLWRRYVIGNPVFIVRVYLRKLFGRKR